MDKIQCSAPNSLNIITRCHGYLPSDHAGFASSWSIFRGNGYIDVISCLNFMLVHRFNTKKLFWRWMECTTFSGVPFTAFFYVCAYNASNNMHGWVVCCMKHSDVCIIFQLYLPIYAREQQMQTKWPYAFMLLTFAMFIFHQSTVFRPMLDGSFLLYRDNDCISFKML